MVFPETCRQALVVLTHSWESFSGNLYLIEKGLDVHWKVVKVFPCSLGKNGLRWGRGVHPLENLEGPYKTEGDLSSPAGIFQIGTSFGRRDIQFNIPYLRLRKGHIWVDNPDSAQYNSLLYLPGHTGKNLGENLYEEPLYELGFLIEHNMNPIKKGSGSAIFCHLAEETLSPTAGCLALKKGDLTQTVQWLSKDHHPHLIELPLKEYQKFQDLWCLPLFLRDSHNEDQKSCKAQKTHHP
jgi:L,D-peptidoglycan transpeptidase YkuD (ErfK/YbiS/YcfS/YnhG family)